MAVVMRLFGDAFGRPTPGDGQYLQDFDFEAGGGVGEIVVTPDPQQAMRFDDMTAAWAFWKRQPKCRPLRADGLPNRPLLSTNWEFTDPDRAGPSAQPEKE